MIYFPRSTFLSKEYNKNKILNNLLTKSSKKFVEISTSSMLNFHYARLKHEVYFILAFT
jgi:hypothetical protein